MLGGATVESGGATLDTGGTTVETGVATLDTGGTTLDTGGTTVDTGGTTTVVVGAAGVVTALVLAGATVVAALQYEEHALTAAGNTGIPDLIAKVCAAEENAAAKLAAITLADEFWSQGALLGSAPNKLGSIWEAGPASDVISPETIWPAPTSLKADALALSEPSKVAISATNVERDEI